MGTFLVSSAFARKPAVESDSWRNCMKYCKRCVESVGTMCSVSVARGSSSAIRPHRLIERGGASAEEGLSLGASKVLVLKRSFR